MDHRASVALIEEPWRKSQMKNICAVLFSLLTIFLVPLSAAIQQPVKVSGGLLSGVPGRDPSVTVFKGIPYAAAPVGNLRWKAPAPVVSWKGIRNADNFGPSCIQEIVTERKPHTREFMAHGEISEDCLSLNVWTAAKSASDLHPVYVFFHGGAFREGSGSVAAYDGEGLAKKGIVVITINYRLGVFGFLAHPELTKESTYRASGNYGALDQIAALRWVQENIKAFGGDPTRVVIGGQSAGGMSVHNLIASPLAKGLFHRAIVESGGSSVSGPLSIISDLADAEAYGVKFAALKGAHSLIELRALTWQKLAEPVQEDQTPAKAGALPALRFSPIVDGYYLPAQVSQVVAQGKQNDVPILTGANKGELGKLIMGPQEPVSVESYVKQARQQYADMADEFLKLYPAATDKEAQIASEQSDRDQSLVSMYLWAKMRAKTSNTKAFLYLWDHTLPGPDAQKYGAFHTAEVPFVMNTLYMSDRPFTEADRRIADMMSSYWANFISTGDPNGKGLPSWPAFRVSPEVMEVGDINQPVPVAGSSAKFAFFEKYFTREP
jgi:para-nitrobenzyl esterase